MKIQNLNSMPPYQLKAPREQKYKDNAFKLEKAPMEAPELKQTFKVYHKRVGGKAGPQTHTFLVSGFDYFGLSKDKDDGLLNLSERLNRAKHYDWHEKKRLLEDLVNTSPEDRIVLIGHSLGGDTVVEAAEFLRELSGAERKVDLLVTLDSFGFFNDIIPPNVIKNLNYIGHQSWPLNDEANVARDYGRTKVENILRNDLHIELDDAADIHRTIIDHIKNLA